MMLSFILKSIYLGTVLSLYIIRCILLRLRNRSSLATFQELQASKVYSSNH